jgi:ubiquinone/menaquinone biosynthesis C-methylase UbiE
MLPLYVDPCFTFRFADDRMIPRFHLEGVEVGRHVSVFKIDPSNGEMMGLLATTTVGEGGWVELTEPIIVRAGEAFVAVPEQVKVAAPQNRWTMTNKADEHQRLIREQFTKQAIPFSQMQNHSPELLLAASGAGPTDTVLDVACGPGLMACAFAKVAWHVTGIDLTPAMIEQAKVMQQSDSLTNLTWHVGDVQRLPFAAASFSLVFNRYSFHHFLDPKVVLAEMVRVCSHGGRVVVVDVFTSGPEQAEEYNRMEKLRDPSHVRALALEELTALLTQAGLQDLRTQLYRHEVELEQVLQRSFPNHGDADTIRQIFAEDLSVNRLGVGAHSREGSIHYAYPIAVVVGQK